MIGTAAAPRCRSSADAASTSLGLRLARSSSHRSSFLTMGILRTTVAPPL